MIGMLVAYVRVSASYQNPERQIEGIKTVIEPEKIFIDHFTGKMKKRPAFDECMNFLRDGDHLYVYSMDRLARNLFILKEIVNDLISKKIPITFVKEAMTFTGNDNPMNNFFLHMMGAIAEFESALITERQREGIELAKKRGVYPGRKRILNEDQMQLAKEWIKNGMSKNRAAMKLGISLSTLYSYLGPFRSTGS